MSRLSEIYAALAATPVSAEGKTPTVYDCDALPPAVTTAQLPCRLLHPPGRLLEAQANGALALSGGRQIIRWRLTDLLLWAPVGQGRHADQSGALLAYCEAYAGAVRPGVPLDTSASRGTVVGVSFEPGVFTYPQPDGSAYYGVECRVWVEEIT